MVGMNKAQQVIALTESMGIDEGFASNLTSALSSGVKSATGAVSGGVKKIKQADLKSKATGAFGSIKKAARSANQTLPKVKPGGGLRFKAGMTGGAALAGLKKKAQNLKSRVPGSYPGRDVSIRKSLKAAPGAMMKRGQARLQQMQQQAPKQGPSKAGFLLNKVKGQAKDAGKKAAVQGTILKQTVPFLAKEKIRQAKQSKAGQLIQKAGSGAATGAVAGAKATGRGVATGYKGAKKAGKATRNVAGDIAHSVRMNRRYTKRQHRKDQKAYQQAKSDYDNAVYQSQAER